MHEERPKALVESYQDPRETYSALPGFLAKTPTALEAATMLRRAQAALGAGPSGARPLLQALGLLLPTPLRAKSSQGPAEPKSPADEAAEFLGGGQSEKARRIPRLQIA